MINGVPMMRAVGAEGSPGAKVQQTKCGLSHGQPPEGECEIYHRVRTVDITHGPVDHLHLVSKKHKTTFVSDIVAIAYCAQTAKVSE